MTAIETKWKHSLEILSEIPTTKQLFSFVGSSGLILLMWINRQLVNISVVTSAYKL